MSNASLCICSGMVVAQLEKFVMKHWKDMEWYNRGISSAFIWINDYIFIFFSWSLMSNKNNFLIRIFYNLWHYFHVWRSYDGAGCTSSGILHHTDHRKTFCAASDLFSANILSRRVFVWVDKDYSYGQSQYS